MFDFGKDICKWIVGILSDVSNMFTDKIYDTAGIEVSKFAPTVYTITKTINETIIIPISSTILVFVIGWEFIEMMMKKTQGRETTLEDFFEPGIKLIFGIILVSNAYNLVNLFFELGKWMVDGTKALLKNSFKVGIEKEKLLEEIEKISAGEAIGLAVILIIVMIVLIGANIFAYVYILTWVFEIYVILATSSLSISTFFSDRFKSMGEGQMKQAIKLAIQGVMFVIVIGIYSGIMNDIKLDGQGIIVTLCMVAVPPVVLSVMIKKTGNLAQAVLGMIPG